MMSEMICYNSSDPAAVNATLLYSQQHDSKNLWEGKPNSLPVCSASYDFVSQCVLCCLLQVVYAVCRNLTEEERVVMEGDGVRIDIMRSECPGYDSADSAPRHRYVTAFVFIVFILIILVLLAVCGWRSYKKRGGGRNELQDQQNGDV